MTNEEKAKEIAWDDSLYNDDLSCAEECFIAAKEMAKWKDEQLKQIQEREIKICNDYIEKHSDNKLMLKYQLGKIALCDELLNTDSRSKINMAFATMD